MITYFRALTFLLLVFKFLFIRTVDSYTPRLCGCIYATSCTKSSTSCCPGLSCLTVDPFGNTQCLESSQYTSAVGCTQTNQNGCSRNSDCCNPVAVCSSYKNCILNHTCTNYYIPPDPSSQPTSLPSRQPFSKPTSIPTRQPEAHPTYQPISHPTNQPSSQPKSKPTKQPTRQPSRSPVLRPSTQPTKQPFKQPSMHPSKQPNSRPTSQPSLQPFSRPTCQPLCQPSLQPSGQPKARPSAQPAHQPSSYPTFQPSVQPSFNPFSLPTSSPSKQPLCSPSLQPSVYPTLNPSQQPKISPTIQPIQHPTRQPNNEPSNQPKSSPTNQPSRQPTKLPAFIPTAVPSLQPSTNPTTYPSSQPSRIPSKQPFCHPTLQPSCRPTIRPTQQPSMCPSAQPTSVPSRKPSDLPTIQPSASPSACPFALPTSQPSSHPTTAPSEQPFSAPSIQPSTSPSKVPIMSPSSDPSQSPSSQPSLKPSVQPMVHPSVCPTSDPSSFPSDMPSRNPSFQPSQQPTGTPTGQPSGQPLQFPSLQPIRYPTGLPTVIPSGLPSSQPSLFPTLEPSSLPTTRPSPQPFSLPTACPTLQPTEQPTREPNMLPSSDPTSQPSLIPSSQPSVQPSAQPTQDPSMQPLTQPSTYPTVSPTLQPSNQPISSPSDQPSSSPSLQPYLRPTLVPTQQPDLQPSSNPSTQPILYPTKAPTCQPSQYPLGLPTLQPASYPSSQPSSKPTFQYLSSPTGQPSLQPLSNPSKQPSWQPISSPSHKPSEQPYASPSTHPSSQPQTKPTTQPSRQPIHRPSSQPSKTPSALPTKQPVVVTLSFIVTNLSSSHFSIAESEAFVTTVAQAMSVDVSCIDLVNILGAGRKLEQTQSFVVLPRITANVPVFLYPVFQGNATALHNYLFDLAHLAVLSGQATSMFRSNILLMGVIETRLPNIISVFVGDTVIEPSYAPTQSPLSTSDFKSNARSTTNNPLVVGLAVGSIFFICVFFPIAFLISKRSWDKNKEKNELDIKPFTVNSSNDRNSLEIMNDSKEFNFTMDENMKKTIEEKMQTKRVYPTQVNEPRLSQQLSLHDCNAEAPLVDKEPERFATYHSIYMQSDVDLDKFEDVADSDNLPQSLPPIPPTISEAAFKAALPRGEESRSLIFGLESAEGAPPPPAGGRTTSRRDSELASSRSGKSRKASSFFFTLGAVDKMDRVSTEMVCLDDDYCSSSTSMASNQDSKFKVGIESNTSIFGSQKSPKATSHHNGQTPQKIDSFYTFGSVDRMQKPESFDISEFYPGSESFDNEFASSVLSSMVGMHGDKDLTRGMKCLIPQKPASHGVAIDFHRNDDDNDDDDSETFLGSDGRASIAELPRSMSMSLRRFSSNDGQFTRISTEKEDSDSRGVAVDAWQQSRAISVGTDHSVDHALHMSSSPHSVKFKAIKNKFETMIQQNHHTKHISLTPAAKSSRGVALGGHRRSRSDGNIRKSDPLRPDAA